ncbi:DNA-binding SARP family transcriptional activator [Deinococcus budaensis]|uniref:DNA-binding SARP family transcriptional activator n=1 Tax=Deinococcus budaensis TaxID=1665626 RepID=A0A7W8GHR9_9DEIO|nr:BTAD domain-containing putative transcriptional regulator [Deinococcus budaensis]MBB5235887.1 DNA-binding SARP family transcriptional activator [Deinococcus budaensis]
MRGTLRRHADPDHPVLACLAAGDFEQGLRRHAALAHPTPTDDLWAGQCLVLLQRRLEGLTLLLRARARGEEDAGALAAVAYRFGGEVERAAELLAGLHPARLSAFGRAVADRELGLGRLHAGRPREALGPLRRAWETAVTDAVAGRFLGSFSAALGLALAELGQDAAAAEHVGQALAAASPPQRAALLWVRMLSAVQSGQFAQAQRDLDDLAALPATPDAAPLLHYGRGVLAHTRGLGSEAAEHYCASAAAAREAGQPETEFYARLRLSALATARGDLGAARQQLARAGALASGERMAASLALRRGAWQVRGHDPQARATLERARRGFETLQLERELGLTHLQLAEAAVRGGDPDAAGAHLARAADLRHALGSGTVLAAELRELPAAYGYLRGAGHPSASPYLGVLWSDVQALEVHLPAELTLSTLGRAGLTLEGQRVRLNVGLPRTALLLAFLLDHGEASLETLQTQVFGDHAPRQARDYLHVARNALGKRLPQLQVPFDRARRVYSLRPCGVRLCWDVQELRQALGLGGETGLRRALGLYAGPFLPESESSWAAQLREELEWSLLRSGLETLETLRGRGEYAACVGLAQRLLEIQPLDVGISTLLVQVFHALRGHAAARQELARVSQVFQRELGEVPEPLLALQRGTWATAH